MHKKVPSKLPTSLMQQSDSESNNISFSEQKKPNKYNIQPPSQH